MEFGGREHGPSRKCRNVCFLAAAPAREILNDLVRQKLIRGNRRESEGVAFRAVATAVHAFLPEILT